jgi:hypothetical protein
MTRRLAVLVVALAALALVPGSSAITGEQRLLLILVTWGPEPYPQADAHEALTAVGPYIRGASFGRTWVEGDVTPWLRALPAQPLQCDLAPIERAATAAATGAGFDVSRYTRLGFLFPEIPACPWGGAYFSNAIWANGYVHWVLLAHELGHLYGVPEEGPAWNCSAGPCRPENYASPYSVMGHGAGDFNAFEKVAFGWVDDVFVPRAGGFALAPIDRPSTLPQAARILAGGDEYWLEYRPPAPLRDPHSADASPGVIVHAGDNGVADEPSRFPQRNLLLLDPAGRGRPSVQAGETFSVPGVLAVAVTALSAERADLRLEWTDRARPTAPRILAPAGRVRGGRVTVRWRAGRDTGSGVAAHELRLDGGRARVVPAVRELGTLVVATDSALALGRLRPGRHRVSVVAVDRAGNRSPAAVRSFRVG